MQTFEIGNLIISLAGRDKGNYYIVKQTDEFYAYVVNGKDKSNLKPKKKKFKHIKQTGKSDLTLKKKWQNREKVLDTEIKKAIENLNLL